MIPVTGRPNAFNFGRPQIVSRRNEVGTSATVALEAEFQASSERVLFTEMNHCVLLLELILDTGQ